MEKQEDNYTSFFELEVWVQDFKDILHLITNYGPSSIELLEPKSIQLNLNQTQEVLNEFASAVHYYISLIVQLTKETRERLGAK